MICKQYERQGEKVRVVILPVGRSLLFSILLTIILLQYINQPRDYIKDFLSTFWKSLHIAFALKDRLSNQTCDFLGYVGRISSIFNFSKSH